MTCDFFATLQAEVGPWVAQNFPEQADWEPLLGIVEELGELGEASEAQDEEQIVDAIGDATIFIADYCNHMRFDMAELWVRSRDLSSEQANLAYHAVARLCQAHLKLHQGVRGTPEEYKARAREALVMILNELGWSAELMGTDLAVVTGRVWEQVRRRNWRRYPHDGLTR